MPVRRLQVPLLVFALLVVQAVSAGPSLAAGERSPASAAAWSGLVQPNQDEGQRRAVAADLRYPAGPVGSHRPRFVAQTGKNCAFASAVMLLDKWTAGRQRPNQARLRLASRVPASEGVSLSELSRAVGRVSGMDLRFSPGGGDPLSWDRLMSRLARGGGAVLGGAYSRLPRHYTRWARDFASQGARASGHAVYIERYEPGRNGGRVWLMDPLGKAAGYRGEWISARALRAFAWINTKGLVTAAATPEPPALAGYDFGTPQVDDWLVAGGELKVRLPFTTSAGWSKPPELSLAAEWRLLSPEPDRETLLVRAAEADDATRSEPADPAGGSDVAVAELGPLVIGGRATGLADDAALADESAQPDEAEPPAPAPDSSVELALREGALVGTLRAPAEAGLYRLTLELRRPDGRTLPKGEAPSLAAINLHLRGELAAEFSLLPLLETPIQGTTSRIQFEVVNRGSLDWLGGEAISLRADWHSSIGDLPGGQTRIDLAAGYGGTFTLELLVPTQVSEATLNVELFDSGGVPLSAYGAEPLESWLRFASESGSSDGPPAVDLSR